MLLIKGRRDKKCTLQFRTKSGVRRFKPQNILNEQTNFDYVEEQVIEHSEGERTNVEGGDING